MWLLFYLFFHVSTGWARMPKPCFIAQIYCFLKCCTKSFGYKYLLNYINIYKLLTHKHIPDTHIHVICIVMVSQGGLSGIFLRKDRDSNPGNPKGLTVFETAPIDHSGIFPYITRGRTCRFVGAKVLNDFDVCNIRTCISKLFFSYSNPKRTNACIVCLLTHAAV